MKIPKIYKFKNKKYILQKIYNNYALYKNMENGIKESFSFHQLGLIKEIIEPPKKIYKQGLMTVKK